LPTTRFESSGPQVYVVSFPKPDQKRQISINGGVQARWRKDGKELYYLSSDGKMMAVDVIASPSLSSGTPHPLFDTGLTNISFDGDNYAVTADGQRFLLLKPLNVQPAAANHHWTTRNSRAGDSDLLAQTSSGQKPNLDLHEQKHRQ
jgi:hypothetical protein